MTKLTLTIKLPDWTFKSVVFAILLYRRIRYGYAFRRIALTRGKFAIVDPADYERLAKHKWYAAKRRNTYYAARDYYCRKKKVNVTVQMHRSIFPAPKGLFVDHINRDGLDNRSVNLRSATAAENNRNRSWTVPNKASKYRGVYKYKGQKFFSAAIRHDRKKINLGTFKAEIAAAIAYDRAANKYHGAFAVLNFPRNSRSLP